MLPSFCRETALVIRPTQVMDERGNPVQDRDLTDTVLVHDCWLSRGSVTEVAVGAVRSRQQTATLHTPSGVEVDADCQVRTQDGVLWDVQGDSRAVESPTGAVSHCVVSLVREVGGG